MARFFNQSPIVVREGGGGGMKNIEINCLQSLKRQNKCVIRLV